LCDQHKPPPTRREKEKYTVLTKSKAPTGLLEEAMGAGALCEEVRAAVRETLIAVAHEELDAALGADRYQRRETLQGYRHGTVTRQVTTRAGRIALELPRARLRTPEGGTAEWAPAVVPRYQRRMADVDEAILRCYLGGVNTRKVSAVLQPLLESQALSRSAVSRITGRSRAASPSGASARSRMSAWWRSTATAST
jgi:transposase-like protein